MNSIDHRDKHNVLFSKVCQVLLVEDWVDLEKWQWQAAYVGQAQSAGCGVGKVRGGHGVCAYNGNNWTSGGTLWYSSGYMATNIILVLSS